MKKIDIITLAAVGVLFAAATMTNLLQPNRPTYSALEQRTLAAAPAFSVKALTSGTYFSDWAMFFSDTFVQRDRLVDLAKEIDTLMGVPYDLGGKGQFAVLQGNTQKTDGPSEDDEARLEDAFAQLEQTKTTEPVTEETESPETENAETSEVDGPVILIPKLKLSHKRLQLTVGSGAVVRAEVRPSDMEHPPLTWTTSDESILSLSEGDELSINVKGVSAGECTLTCHLGEDISMGLTVTVMAVTNTGTQTEDDTVEFLTNGMFIYGDGVYIPAYYGEPAAKYFAQTTAYYQSLFGEDIQVSVVMAPVSSMVIDDAEVKARVKDQREIQNNVAALMDERVNFVDVYSSLYEHKDEYIFYKSDHHWTAKGAYYAYTAFAKSRGLEPVALEDLTYSVKNNEYYGSLYLMTKDSRVKGFSDVVEAWATKKKLTMTVSTSYGSTVVYDSPIVPGYASYIAFIGGDNPYTVINVPENPQDRNILVLKDSFGNALVPYLCEHYGNIIVVDVRYTEMNLYEQLKDYGLTDILFVNNVQSALNTAWPRMYLKVVGVEG